MNYLPKQYGFRLPDLAISFEDQHELVTYTKNLFDDGKVVGSSFTTKSYTGSPFVYSLALRGGFKDGKLQNSSLVNRFNTELEWDWHSFDLVVPILPTVKRILEPVMPLYTVLTRVVILLQIPSQTLPLHNDYYPQWKSQHEANGCYALKFPLTEQMNNPGIPVVELDNEVMFYDVGNNAFMLNDVDIPHGSLPVDHTRGVLFLDGIMDMDKINSLHSELIPIEKAPINKALYLKRN
jgi:hypothetical protein